jgi:hypothetical protein
MEGGVRVIIGKTAKYDRSFNDDWHGVAIAMELQNFTSAQEEQAKALFEAFAKSLEEKGAF